MLKIEKDEKKVQKTPVVQKKKSSFLDRGSKKELEVPIKDKKI